MPGTIATCSQPSSRNTGQRPSRSCAPSTSVPSEGRGATFFAAIATPKCAMNMLVLEAVAHAVRRDGGARAARRMALHVDRHGVHGDVRGGKLDVHGEGGGV